MSEFVTFLFFQISFGLLILFLTKYLVNYHSDYSNDGNAIKRFTRKNDLYNQIDLTSRAKAAIELTNTKIVEQYFKEHGIDISEHSSKDLFSPKVDLESPSFKLRNSAYR